MLRYGFDLFILPNVVMFSHEEGRLLKQHCVVSLPVRKALCKFMTRFWRRFYGILKNPAYKKQELQGTAFERKLGIWNNITSHSYSELKKKRSESSQKRLSLDLQRSSLLKSAFWLAKPSERTCRILTTPLKAPKSTTTKINPGEYKSIAV